MAINPQHLVHFPFKAGHTSARHGGIRITPQHASKLPHIAATTLIESTPLLLESDGEGGAAGPGYQSAKICLQAHEIDQARLTLERILSEPLDPKEDSLPKRAALLATTVLEIDIPATINIYRHKGSQEHILGLEIHNGIWILLDGQMKLLSALELKKEFILLKSRSPWETKEKKVEEDLKREVKPPSSEKRDELLTKTPRLGPTREKSLKHLLDSKENWTVLVHIHQGKRTVWGGNKEWVCNLDDPSTIQSVEELGNLPGTLHKKSTSKKTDRADFLEFINRCKEIAVPTAEDIEEQRTITKTAAKVYLEIGTDSVDYQLPQILIPKGQDYVSLTPLSAPGASAEVQIQSEKTVLAAKRACTPSEHLYNIPANWQESFLLGGAQPQNAGVLLKGILRNTLEFPVPQRDSFRRKAWGIFHQGLQPRLSNKLLNEYGDWILKNRKPDGTFHTNLRIRKEEETLLKQLLKGPFYQAQEARELLQEHVRHLNDADACPDLLHIGWINPGERDHRWKKLLGKWLAKTIVHSLPKIRSNKKEILLGKSDLARIESQVQTMTCPNW